MVFNERSKNHKKLEEFESILKAECLMTVDKKFQGQLSKGNYIGAVNLFKDLVDWGSTDIIKAVMDRAKHESSKVVQDTTSEQTQALNQLVD